MKLSFACFCILISLIRLASAQTPLGWRELPNTQISPVCQNGPGTCAPVLSAWNSGLFDTERNRLIIWGGGHGDYSGNEIYAINLNGTPGTERITNTTAGGCSQESCDGGATPNSRHTYDGIEYMANIDRMFVFGGSRAGNGYFLTGTWTFKFADKTWHLMNPSGGSPGGNGGVNTAYDPNTGKVFVNDMANFYAYTFSTNSYQLLGSASYSGSGHATATVDPKRKKFVVFGGGESAVYDISGSGSYNRQVISTTGATNIVSADYPGLAYDPVRDRIVGYAGGNTVYSLNMDTKVWTSVSSAGTPGSAQGTGTYGRWNYSPALDAFIIVNSININAWTFRFPAGSSSAEQMALPQTHGIMDINIYPNPLSSRAVIIFPKALKGADISICDVAGKLVWQLQGANLNQFDWTAGNARSGIYVLKVKADGKSYSKKMMIQK